MNEYEYINVHVNRALIDVCKAYGKHGWQLVNYDESRQQAIFMREKLKEE